MNERIRELSKQAWEWAEQQEYNDPAQEFSDILEQKFAELIVRECLAHGKSTQSQPVVNGSEEYNAGREMGIEVFMNKIKQHFGVE